MLRTKALTIAAAVVLGLAGCTWAAPGKFPSYTDPKEAGPDYDVQGEYQGQLSVDGGTEKFGAQVIALGEGNFRAVLFRGGLPGDGWQRGGQQEEAHSDGQTKGGRKVTFAGSQFKADIAVKQGVMTVYNTGGDKRGSLEKVCRTSPTLGAKPPQGATVLFDGSNLDQFEGGKLTEQGTLLIEHPPQPALSKKRVRGDVYSKQSFGDFALHLEFATPFMPTASGQARGNSGLYLQNRYEVQVLDSFGLEGKNNECGGIYKVQDPKVNMCLPPLAWQTYDIDFTAPRFDATGNKTAGARVTVRHNGVAIYEDFELPSLTPGGDSKEAATGPLKLQDHGNPVQYRNIWVVEKK